MINVKLIVLFFSIHNVASSSKYCEICPNHTLCKYNMPGPSSACKDYASTPITKDDVNNIINKINERRNSVALGLAGLPQAANMNKIYWSEELATLAQRWVDQCDASARPDKEDECRDLDGTAVGQAIVSVLGPAPGLQLKNMVDVWFMQTLDYKGSVSYYNQSRDWKTNYFTQLIWGETDRIGCGRARFYVDQKKSIIERLVCNFAPKGNIHGKPVYAVGYPATQCQQHKTPDSRFESLCRSLVEVKCLRGKIKNAFFETHMMVSKPEQWIAPMADAGVNQYTFHIEPVTNVEDVCRKIKEHGMKVGVAIKPGTPVSEVEKYISMSDMVLIMTVEPGFGGQKFMQDQMAKVQYLREHYPLLDIEVDGGVGPATIGCCANAGANMIVSGTAVIGAADQASTIKQLRDTVQSAINKR